MTNVNVLAALRQIADGEGDTEILAARVYAAVAELIDAATDMAGVQVNRRPSVRNDLGSAKKARLRAAIARATQGAPTNGK